MKDMKLITGFEAYIRYRFLTSLSNEGKSSILSAFLPRFSYYAMIRCLIVELELESIASSIELSTSLPTIFFNKSSNL